MEFDELYGKIISCAIEVHKNLGPGLLESAYERCLSYELNAQGLNHETQKELPVDYKNIKLDCGYRIDLIVENSIIIARCPYHHSGTNLIIYYRVFSDDSFGRRM